MTKNLNVEKTDTRRINLVYNFPFVRMKCVSIELTQKDVLTIIRQINNTKIRDQLIEFIYAIDDWGEYDLSLIHI